MHTNQNVNTCIGIILLKVPLFSVTKPVTIEEGNEKLPDRCIATIWELYETSSLAIRSTVNGNHT